MKSEDSVVLLQRIAARAAITEANWEEAKLDGFHSSRCTPNEVASMEAEQAYWYGVMDGLAWTLERMGSHPSNLTYVWANRDFFEASFKQRERERTGFPVD